MYFSGGQMQYKMPIMAVCWIILLLTRERLIEYNMLDQFARLGPPPRICQDSL